MKIHHVQLAIPPGSEDQCRKFYCAILGWQEMPKPEPLVQRGGLWLQSGQAELHLGVEENFRPARKAHPAFIVEEIEAIAVKLKNHGLEITWDESIADFKRFFVFDAVGNRLEFMEHA